MNVFLSISIGTIFVSHLFADQNEPILNIEQLTPDAAQDSSDSQDFLIQMEEIPEKESLPEPKKTEQPLLVIDPCLSPCPVPVSTCCENAGFYVFGDYLYLQTREEGLGFGYETRAGVVNNVALLTIGQIGKEKNIKPGFSSGFRIGIDYHVPTYEWDIETKWMRYSNNKRNGLPFIDPTIDNLPQVISLGTIISEDLLDKSGTLYGVLQKANAHWKLHYNIVDFELSRIFFPCECFSLKPLIGIRGGWIKQSFNIQYLRPVEFTTDQNFDASDPIIFVNANWNFNGWGLRGGLDVNWKFGSGFSIYSNGSISLLCSGLKLKHKERFGNGFLRTNLKEKVDTITPGFEIAIGLAWERFFCCERYYLNIHAGWEETLWLDINQTQRFSGMISPSVNTKSGIHTRRDRGNLGLSGLQVGATFGF